MTNPVILLGTQSNGETLPVQVDATGRLVAEGLQGEQGEQGEQGIQGPPGPPGSDGIDLPPDPYEGAFLGWLNGELAWIGTPPVPIPPGVFGPITTWSPDGLLTVEGSIPSEVGPGVYVIQVGADGKASRPDQSWYLSDTWSDGCDGLNPTNVFNPDESLATSFKNSRTGLMSGAVEGITIAALMNGWGSASYELIVNNTISLTAPRGSSGWTWGSWTLPQKTMISSLEIKSSAADSGEWAYSIRQIKIDGITLIDPDLGQLVGRVNQKLGEQQLLVVPTSQADFSVGQYLRLEEQRVAPWVLYGNDPTTHIDYLRQIRD